MRTKPYIKKMIIYIILIVAAFCLQTSFFPMFSGFCAAPNLLMIIVYSTAFIYGRTAGMFCGVLSGLLMDFYYPVPLGFFILIYTLAGFINGSFRDSYYDDFIILPVFFCISSELIYNGFLLLYRYLTAGHLDFLFFLKNKIIPEILFTLILTLILYRVFLHANRYYDKVYGIQGRDSA